MLKRAALSLAFVFCLSCSSSGGLVNESRVLEESFRAFVITPSLLRGYTSFLADPESTFGRGTGQIGYEITRDFLVRHLRVMGYEVIIQSFPAYQRILPGDAETDTVYSWNIIGVLRGEDPSGVIMFSAHADHIGIIGTQVYPGADDNASGVSVVLGIARAFSLHRGRFPILRRSVVVCFFGAEEGRGMAGSSYFVESALFQNMRPVAFLNFDMVGRGGRDSLAVFGSENNGRFRVESPTLYSLVRGLNSERLEIINLRSSSDSTTARLSDSFRRSDHWNFYKKEIPVLFFFTGIHDDYHRTTDTAERLDYDKMTRIARLGFRIGLRIARSNTPVVFRPDSVYLDLR